MGGRRAASPPSRTTQRNPRVRSISRAPMPGGHARCRSSFSRRQASSWRVMPERLLCGPSGRAWSTPADSRCAGDRRSIAGGPAACALRRVSRSGLMCMEEARGACRGTLYRLVAVRCRRVRARACHILVSHIACVGMDRPARSVVACCGLQACSASLECLNRSLQLPLFVPLESCSHAMAQWFLSSLFCLCTPFRL